MERHAGVPIDGIVFGGRRFSEPHPIPVTAVAGLPDQAGLYVVLAPDATWGPRPFRPIYFGESGEIWLRSTAGHEKWSAWVDRCGVQGVYRSLHPMPGSTRRERQAAESALISAYNTPCNDRVSVSLAALLARAY